MSLGKAKDAEIWDYERKHGVTKTTDVPPDDPVISAVTQEVKESYGYGHDDGYRTATHDIADWLRRKGVHSPAIRQLANEISAGTWKETPK